ncbi:MAG TPA: hypothetical protein VGX91_01230 [Candidatus Cybelea sp.]|jgi:hypothetical protein|nr:hypothetical protein [Candidatus Cybelea sp.]
MIASITVDGEPVPLELDFENHRWSSKRELPESYFPLVATIEGKRYELYSDATFAEVEL